LDHHVSHTVHGRLRGDLCGDFDEPLAGMVVRLYSAGSTDGRRRGGEPAEVAEILDDRMIESHAPRLLVEATTYPDGSFAATLPEQRYDGGALDVDVCCRAVPGMERPHDEQGEQAPVQVHVTRLRPSWSDEPYREISFEHSLPASVWSLVREKFDAWVICGRVVERKTDKLVAGAVVRVFDTDPTQDGPLGTATTDHNGYFRIDYTRDGHAPISPVESTYGPDLYFQVESRSGAALLDEARPRNQKPIIENVGSCTRVELSVPNPAPKSKLYDSTFEARRKDEIASSTDHGRAPVATDGDVYFRPFELLLSSSAVEALRTELTGRYGAERYYPDPKNPHWRSHHNASCVVDINERLQAAGIDLQLYVLRRNVDPNSMTKVARALRSQLPASEQDPGFGVHVNHVVFAEQFYHGGPDGFPWSSNPPSSWPGPTNPPQNIDIAVLDTGVWANWATVHPALNGKVWPDPDDNDLLDETDPPGGLDTCAGHGLFICGLIHRMDGELQIDPCRVLTSIGDGDDVSVAVELFENTAPVINMSFGCHTEDDLAPPVLAGIITNLIANGRVMVAAAGNGGTTRPFWPAAMPDVIAVGSWDDSTGTIQRAPTSNYGPWVDVYACGVDLLSSYVDGIGTFKKWAHWNGTSFATPQIAAEIAIRARRTGQPHKIVAANMLAPSGPEALPPSEWGGKLYESAVDLTN